MHQYMVSEYTVMTGPSYQLFCLLVVSDFTFSKLRIALRENSMENIIEGICQTLKSSKHFITLISMLKTLYFVYIFTPQKSVKKKCTFLCILS